MEERFRIQKIVLTDGVSINFDRGGGSIIGSIGYLQRLIGYDFIIKCRYWDRNCWRCVYGCDIHVGDNGTEEDGSFVVPSERPMASLERNYCCFGW